MAVLPQQTVIGSQPENEAAIKIQALGRRHIAARSVMHRRFEQWHHTIEMQSNTFESVVQSASNRFNEISRADILVCARAYALLSLFFSVPLSLSLVLARSCSSVLRSTALTRQNLKMASRGGWLPTFDAFMNVTHLPALPPRYGALLLLRDVEHNARMCR